MSSFDENAGNIMKNIINKTEYHDVILVAGIDLQKISAHRLILIASSKYFEALLGPNFCEGAQDEVLLKEIDGSTLKSVVDYIYSGQIEINDENVVQLMTAASGMELVSLEKRCGDFWEAKLALENCVEIFLNADKFMLNDLRMNALKFICHRFDNVPIDDMLHIDEKNLRELLTDDQITAAETVIFDRLVQLIEHKNSETFKFDAEFTEIIRLEHIPTPFLTETIEPFCKKYDCFHIVLNEYRKRLLQPKAISAYRYVPEAMYCSFSNSSSDGINIQKYDFGENNWSEYKNIPIEAKRCFGSILFDGELFVMGGYKVSNFRYYNYLSDVESYNLENLTKTTLLPMRSRRSDFTPISIGKYIYVFGGAQDRAIAACERFNTEKRVWEQLSSIPCACSCYHAFEFNGMIYVASGNGLQCYNPNSDFWSAKASLPASLSLAYSKELIYGIESNWTVYQYDANQDIWTTIGWFGNFGTITRIISHSNQFYVLCKDGKFEYLKMGESCTLIRLNGPANPGSGRPYIFFK